MFVLWHRIEAMADQHRLLWIGGLALAPWLGQFACANAPGQANATTTAVASVGTGTLDAGIGGEGGGTGGQAAVVGVGGGEPVFLGMNANALQTGDEPPTGADRLVAQLTAQAAGIRVVFIDAPWDSVDPDALAGLISDYANQELRVVVNLLVVDGHADRRPDGIAALDWDDSDAVAAIQSTIDAILTAGRDRLDALVIARRSDAYLEEHSDEAAAFASFAAGAVGYAQSMGPADVDVGVGVTYQQEPTQEVLIQLGSIAAFSYFPGLSEAMLPGGLAVAKDLDFMLNQAEDRPVVLQQVGFSSEMELGGSEQLQQQTFDDFFAALAPRRASFPMVNVHQLHDLSPAACEGLAFAQGIEASAPEARYLCAAGLRDAAGEAKPAWYPFLDAAATFGSP